ncbi:MAG: hypothetical protein JKY42_08255 [Flavobacteriales bacterium]|nr:hypothetical protein [Flavobacteriales bacterium]
MKNVALLSILAIGLFSCGKLSIDKVGTNIIDNCETVSNLDIRQNANNVWELATQSGKTYPFPNYDEAYKTKRILENYRATSLCKCGHGVLTNENGEEVDANLMSYQLRENMQGIGNQEENSYNNGVEDCLPFNPEKLIAKQDLSGDWYLIERPNHSMFGFGKDKDACINALKVIKKYGFNQSCFVGRPNPSFTYLKNYQIDTPPLTEESLR